VILQVNYLISWNSESSLELVELMESDCRARNLAGGTCYKSGLSKFH